MIFLYDCFADFIYGALPTRWVRSFDILSVALDYFAIGAPGVPVWYSYGFFRPTISVLLVFDATGTAMLTILQLHTGTALITCNVTGDSA